MQLKKLAHAVMAVCAGVALAACSAIELPTKKIDYKSAGKLPSLEVPPDLTRPSADDRFVVPGAGNKGAATFSEYDKARDGRPQLANTNASVLPTTQDARIERSGTQRWLVVKGDPVQIWPLVKDFWQENGFIVNVESPEAGLMETDWAENRAKIDDGLIRRFFGRVLDSVYATAERDKFRTRLERGATGTTEIYVSHRGMEEVYISEGKDNTRWQPRKADPDLESLMLSRLMMRLGVQEARAKQVIAAASTEPPRATLSKAGGASRLEVNEQFDRAWRRVGLALDRVGFTVEDRDRAKGLYFVRYIDPDTDTKTTKDKPGFFGRMVDGLKFWGNSPAKKNEQYQIAVRDVTSGAEVNVLTKEGRQEQSETANRILTLLYDQLK